MSEREFTLNGRQYKLCKIDVFKQFHITRRLAPIIGDLIAIAPKLAAVKDEASETEKLDATAKLIQPIALGLGKLSEEDANAVLLGLCSAVEVHQPQFSCWARVANEKALNIADLELPTLMQLAGRSFMYNIAGFFSIAPQVSQGGK